jgi:hypothetical protein
MISCNSVSFARERKGLLRLWLVCALVGIDMWFRAYGNVNVIAGPHTGDREYSSNRSCHWQFDVGSDSYHVGVLWSLCRLQEEVWFHH